MIQQHHSAVRDGLILGNVFRNQLDIDGFIERNPCIWLQSIQMPVMDAVQHIDAFLMYQEVDKGTANGR